MSECGRAEAREVGHYDSKSRNECTTWSIAVSGPSFRFCGYSGCSANSLNWCWVPKLLYLRFRPDSREPLGHCTLNGSANLVAAMVRRF
jgi:hypothetical protein